MHRPTPCERSVMAVFERLDREAPSPDEDLFDTGLLDSLMFVDLLARLEDEFGVTFRLEDLDLDRFRTVRAIAGWIEALQAEAPMAGRKQEKPA